MTDWLGVPAFEGSFGLLVFLGVLVLLAMVSARVVGVRVSWLRALVAATIGLVAGIANFYQQSRQTGSPTPFLDELAVPALVATVLVLVIIELTSRPSTLPTVPAGLVSVPHPVRAIRERADRGRRYAQILAIAARNGLNPYLLGRVEPDMESAGERHRLAVACRRTLEDSGGVFVKLGQLLSTRPDLVPPAFIAEFNRLQDAAATVPYEDLAPELEQQLGRAPDAIFATFDREPLAAASIAQVHRAALQNGDQVIVKIARPGIRTLVDRDLAIIQRMARKLAARTAWARQAGTVELADGFATAIAEELDFRIEAANMEALSTSAAAAGLRVPCLHREYSGSQVLVMEWLDGVKLRDSGGLLDQLGVDRAEFARKLLLCILRQIMVEGIFHADPHPGNVMVLRDGTPALIDFGSVGRLDAAQRSALRRILIAFDRRDAAQMREALVELADVRDSRQQDLLERALSEFMARRLGPGMQPGVALLTDLLKLLITFELALPGHVAAVFRALVTMEGTLQVVAPGFEVLDESRRVAGHLLQESISVTPIRQMAGDEIMRQVPILRRLPRRLEQLAATIDEGRLSIHIRLFEDAEDRRLIRTLVGTAVLAFVGAAFSLTGVLLGGTTAELGHISLFVGTLLMLRAVIEVARGRTA